MTPADKNRPQSFRRSPGKIILTVVVVLVVMLAIGVALLAHYAEPMLRAKVIETLSTRFQSRVELDELRITGLRGLAVEGKGLRIFGPSDGNIHKEGIQSLVGVDEFRFSISLLSLLHSPMHVGTVYLHGMELNIPSKQDRHQIEGLASHGGAIKIVVDEFHSDRATLIINNSRTDKMPLEFDIHHLVMRNIGDGMPLKFEAILVNPKPVGDIASQGEFGPFNVADPSASPVRGEYTFDHADLGTLKGIGGILSSKGRYQGSLGEIVVDGETDTPDFRLNVSGRRVPLKTTFHAIVDATSGDTFLKPVRAIILNTPLTATGFVVKSVNKPGHLIKLDVTIPSGKIEDLLRLAVRTDPPVMTGAIHLRSQLEIIPGDPDLSERIHLKGSFQVTGAHFSNEHIQGRVDALSMRSLGKPGRATDAIADNVKSQMGGDFVLKNSILTLPHLLFQMPGTHVALAGDYSLDGNQFDFHGKARFDAHLSQMVGGWKSIFLKPVDPFFSKHGAGAELPIKITGTKAEPHFGLDFNHRNDEADNQEKIGPIAGGAK